MQTVDIKIDTETIQLDQFLKWAGVIGSGAEVKFLLEERRIKRNGETESARRRRLIPGDIVEIEGVGAWRVTAD